MGLFYTCILGNIGTTQPNLQLKSMSVTSKEAPIINQFSIFIFYLTLQWCTHAQ